ncbi:hypothetical protein [Parasphingorhabdus sp.]|uniref:hypothetical protein n=1 Tax=Parasphingorhabdus sp. TaxID=2709688 RepID=UPI002F9510CB
MTTSDARVLIHAAANIFRAYCQPCTFASCLPINRLGKVRGVIADAHEELLVKVDSATAMLPAANFSGSGNTLVSAMSEGQIKDTAASQKEAAQ